MELNAHDLLEVRNEHNLVIDSSVPDWVFQSLRKAPFVVVRRGAHIQDMAPVGIRGELRSQRFAAFLPFDQIKARITPEQIAEDKIWEQNGRMQSINAIRSLPTVQQILSRYNVTWGPTGSVGFELASRVSSASADSDLDLVIKTSKLLPLSTAQNILKELNAVPVRVDIQLEISTGAISLRNIHSGKIQFYCEQKKVQS
jgi:phosphoribosyl-dephospho-CoA transferase